MNEQMRRKGFILLLTLFWFLFLAVPSLSQTISLSVSPMKAEVYLDSNIPESRYGLIMSLGNDEGDTDALYELHFEPELVPYLHGECDLGDEFWCFGKEFLVEAGTDLHANPVRAVVMFQPYGASEQDFTSYMYVKPRPVSGQSDGGEVTVEAQAKVSVHVHQSVQLTEQQEQESGGVWQTITSMLFGKRQTTTTTTVTVVPYQPIPTFDFDSGDSGVQEPKSQETEPRQPTKRGNGMIYTIAGVSGLGLVVFLAYMYLGDRFPTLFTIFLAASYLMMSPAHADDITVDVQVIEPVAAVPLSIMMAGLIPSSLAFLAMILFPQELLEKPTLLRLLRMTVIMFLLVTFVSAVSTMVG